VLLLNISTGERWVLDMKILNIMLGRGLGGIEQAFLDYAGALKSQGFEVINVTSIFAKVNLRLTQPSCKLPNIGTWDFLSRICLKALIQIIKPDAVIAHGRRAIKFTKFHPLIGVAHNYNIKDLLSCDYIIALTNHMKDHLRHDFPEDRIAVIPNMVSSSLRASVNERGNPAYATDKMDCRVGSKAPPRNDCNSKTKIGTFGRFVKKKGIDVFLQSLALLKEADYKFEAVIGGDGEEKESLVKLRDDLNLTTDVKFVGWVSNKEEFFQNIDIFCLPSLHEPFGIIILEAMSYRVPIISTKTEGPSEILEDKKSALLVDVNSPEGLSKAIARLIDDQEQAQVYADYAYARVQNHYSTDVVAKKLCEFLNNI
jgi:glycosyltransferase involved in cell wall biosynthesis